MTTLNHIPHQAIDGEWHVAYRCPRGMLQSVMAGLPDRSVAAKEADKLNEAARRAQRRAGDERKLQGLLA